MLLCPKHRKAGLMGTLSYPRKRPPPSCAVGRGARLPPPLAAVPLALAPRERACGEEHGEVEGGVRAAARGPGPTGPQLLSRLQLRGRAWGGGAARTPRAVNSAAVAPLRMREFNACG